MSHNNRDAVPSLHVERLVRTHASLVGRIAHQVKARVGRLIDREELEAVGRTALFLAARDHDPEISPFPLYAASRIRWAMIDAVRRETRARSNSGSPVLHVPFEEPETEDDAAARRGGRAAREAVRDPAMSPEELVLALGGSLDIRGAITELDVRERLVLQRHYFEDEAFDAIARSIDLSKSWLSRIHARAIERLGARLHHAPELTRDLGLREAATPRRSVVKVRPEASCDSKKASSSLPEQHRVSAVTSPCASPKRARKSQRAT